MNSIIIHKLFVVGVSFMTAVSLSATPVVASNYHSSTGNTGTIKVDGIPFDSHSDNEPHDGCVFRINAYGYGSQYTQPTVEVQTQAPTKPANQAIYDGVITLDGDSHAGGGSTAGYDGSLLINLSDALHTYSVQNNQGYHLRVLVDTDGSGKLQAKQKTFWVKNCTVTPTVTPTLPASIGGTSLVPENGQTLGAATISSLNIHQLPSTGPVDAYLYIPVIFAVTGAAMLKFKFGIGK